MAIHKQCSVFQELSEAAFPEVLNDKFSNLISYSFVHYKVEDNKEFVATIKELNESFTETCERQKKFQGNLKLKKFNIELWL